MTRVIAVTRVIVVTLGVGLSCTGWALAQPPGRPPGGERRQPRQPATVETFIARLMSLDANGDGAISRDECTDMRLAALLGRADADRSGSVAKTELAALFERESAALRATGGRGPGRFGPPGGPPPGGAPPPRRPR